MDENLVRRVRSELKLISLSNNWRFANELPSRMLIDKLCLDGFSESGVVGGEHMVCSGAKKWTGLVVVPFLIDRDDILCIGLP